MPQIEQNVFWPMWPDLWPLTLTFYMDIIWYMVITPENFKMIWWEEHCEKGVTDRGMN